MLRMLLWCVFPLSFVGVCFARDDHVLSAQGGVLCQTEAQALALIAKGQTGLPRPPKGCRVLEAGTRIVWESDVPPSRHGGYVFGYGRAETGDRAGYVLAYDDISRAQAGPSRGMSQEQINVMQHATSLFVASKWCTNYVVDLVTINEAVRRAKINANTQPHKSYLEQRLRESQESVASAGAVIACAVFYDHYGPSGKSVPGQMIRR